MPKWFSETEKERIQQRLLEHGERMFSSYGLKKTSIEEIARAAGISKGSFYRFYPSKEDLFMAVVEQVEIRARERILAAVERPGPTPRARLVAILQEAFGLLRSQPVLRVISSSDYELLLRSVPAETLRQHQASDQGFIEALAARCRAAGIPLRARNEQMAGLFYALIPALLHADNLAPSGAGAGADLLIELVAAFWLGDVESQNPAVTGIQESQPT